MKDKTLAALLAFFGGWVGLHRFYLGQTGLGVLYCCLFFLTWLVGVIDAIRFLAMDQKDFDLRYNQDAFIYANDQRRRDNQPPLSDRERRFRERQRQRAGRQQKRRGKQQATAPTRRAIETPAGKEERETGIRYFKDFEYDRAILAFNRALELNPRDWASHWNIACAYSCEEEADKAFYHLDRAVSLGFDDFDRIKTHESLAFLRVQPEFMAFAANGFRLVADRRAAESELSVGENDVSTDTPRENGDLLDQLQRLATLREKGLLTEGEFTAQKKRLLG